MNNQTRRGFLAKAGVGAAAGAAALAPAGAAAAVPVPTVPAGVEGPLVAYVRDARAGEVAVLLGEREVVVHDLELAARIATVAAAQRPNAGPGPPAAAPARTTLSKTPTDSDPLCSKSQALDMPRSLIKLPAAHSDGSEERRQARRIRRSLGQDLVIRPSS